MGNCLGQELEGNEAVQPRILSLVDHTHTAAAELLGDAIVRDGCPDHSRTILRGRDRQVNETRGVSGVSEGGLLKNPDNAPLGGLRRLFSPRLPSTMARLVVRVIFCAYA